MQEQKFFTRHLGALPFEVIMAIGAVVMYMKGDRLHVITSLFTLFISLTPLLLEKFFNLRIPSLFQVIFVGFVFSSMFSGEVLRLYSHVPFWDDLVHITSGLLLGTTGMIFLMRMTKKGYFQAPFWVYPIVVLGFVATVVVLWEIIEFTSDQIFGTHSQDSSLIDTMFDLIDGMAGGAIIAILSVFEMKKKLLIFTGLTQRYEKLNK